jgi:hypothetical protein
MAKLLPAIRVVAEDRFDELGCELGLDEDGATLVLPVGAPPPVWVGAAVEDFGAAAVGVGGT